MGSKNFFEKYKKKLPVNLKLLVMDISLEEHLKNLPAFTRSTWSHSRENLNCTNICDRTQQTLQTGYENLHNEAAGLGLTDLYERMSKLKSTKVERCKTSIKVNRTGSFRKPLTVSSPRKDGPKHMPHRSSSTLFCQAQVAQFVQRNNIQPLRMAGWRTQS